MKTLSLAFSVLALVCVTGCSSMYYGTMEKFGVHKRDIMVDRVKEARTAQQDAKKQFANALEQFRSVIDVKGGDLQTKYDKLNAQLQRSEARAKEVHDRIASVEDVSEALFKEWRTEIRQYSSDSLRRQSEQQLESTRTKYSQLITAMKKAAARIDPVLVPLRDQVLFLKHNLNAKAIASLNTELTSVQGNVDVLVRDMEAAIAEADEFIKAMKE
jgi:Skp family chaperone for outer membrane proteins